MILRLSTFAFGALLLSSSATALDASTIPNDIPISKLLTLASSALSSGSASDALAYYDIALSRDPSNYLTLFKRGATQLSLGRSAQARNDFDKALAIKPDFEGALTQRAKLRARAADWVGARHDYQTAGRSSTSEELKALAEAEGAVKLARDAEKHKKWEECVAQAGVAIMTAGLAADLRLIRARCRLERGEVMEAVNDLQHLLQINPSLTDPPLRISAMTFYSLGESTKGVEAVKRCLHRDPDNKACSRLFKREKKIDREVKKARELMEKRSFSAAARLLAGSSTAVDKDELPSLIQMIKDDVKQHRLDGIIHAKAGDELLANVLEMACDAYIEMNNPKRGGPFCTDALALHPDSLPGLLHKATTLLSADDFEGAIRTLDAAQTAHPSAQPRISPVMQNAQTLLKRSRTKDYYATLGVPRDASPKDIKRAWIAATKANHPDKAASPDARPAAEKKMAVINEAYEVLSDPELRERFDRGEDPNDPQAGRGGGNPFQQGGGFPFGGPPGGGGGGQQFFFKQGGPGGGGGGGGGMPNFGQGGFKFQFP